MERTDAIKQYLKNKHQGGENNQKGGLFEDFYAVYQIVSCIAKYKSSFDRVEFQTQLEDTFVDDMLIAHPELNMYHQLKNTQSLSWGKVDKQGDIAFDFAHQMEDCKEREENFALKLVYSLKEIIHKADRFKHVNLKIYSDVGLSEDCKKVLDAIEGFEYRISGRMFYWSIGRMNGSCPWPGEMETEIICQHPTDKWELISMLS